MSLYYILEETYGIKSIDFRLLPILYIATQINFSHFQLNFRKRPKDRGPGIMPDQKKLFSMLCTMKTSYIYGDVKLLRKKTCIFSYTLLTISMNGQRTEVCFYVKNKIICVMYYTTPLVQEL